MRKTMYKTSETLVYKIQEYTAKKIAVVIRNGDIIDFRPMKMQEPLYCGCDVYAFYFRKENKGLKSSGEEHRKIWYNSNCRKFKEEKMQNYIGLHFKMVW